MCDHIFLPVCSFSIGDNKTAENKIRCRKYQELHEKKQIWQLTHFRISPVLGRATHCSSLGHYAVTQRRQPAADQDPPCRVRGVRAGPGRGAAVLQSPVMQSSAAAAASLPPPVIFRTAAGPSQASHGPDKISHCCQTWRSPPAVYQIPDIYTKRGHRCLENEFKWKVSGKEMSFFLWISRKIDCMFLDISEIASWLEKIRFSRNSIHQYYPISSAYLD